MKNIKLIVVTLLSVAFFSCSKDEPTVAQVNNMDSSMASGDTSGSIVGLWTGVSNNYSGTTITSTNGIEFARAVFKGETEEADFTAEITESPNVVLAKGSYKIKLTTTTISFGQSNTQTQSISLPFTTSSTWKKNGDKLIITLSTGEIQEAIIKELTANSLIYEVDAVKNIKEGEFDVKTTIKTISVFKR